MTTEIRIDLNDVRTSFESRVLSGRERGFECREQFNLERVDATPDRVLVLIPKDIYSLNTSFFLGLFGDSVRRFGRDGFLAKYRFDCDEVHRETINYGIDRALKGATIFTGRKLA
jgi:hypothetical protein